MAGFHQYTTLFAQQQNSFQKIYRKLLQISITYIVINKTFSYHWFYLVNNKNDTVSEQIIKDWLSAYILF